jgi:hypothetical protein
MTTKHFFNRDELEAILDFLNKYPDTICVEVNIESDNGIGRLITAQVQTFLNDDWVTVTKTITDQTSW